MEAAENSELDVRADDDQFSNAPGFFFMPVEDATERQDAAETLIEHFRRFGDYWGVDPAEVGTEE
ncbi:hypothetical protein [Halovenus marina]|uniref:hypothetical protein n=1 Tax=Halovenus marina TaxID=3396621 RepID=UPI003F57DFF0